MKFKIIFFVLVAFLSFGCSNILTTFSVSELELHINQISGDELKISQTLIKDDPSQRSLVETKNQSNVGYVKILNEIKRQTDDLITLNQKKLDSSKNLVYIKMEVKIDNSYLELNNTQFDQVLIWIGNNSVALYSGIYEINKNIKEKKFENYTIFNFNFELNKNAKKCDFSVQSLNLIK
mgnify:CR=1 FL=1